MLKSVAKGLKLVLRVARRLTETAVQDIDFYCFVFPSPAEKFVSTNCGVISRRVNLRDSETSESPRDSVVAAQEFLRLV